MLRNLMFAGAGLFVVAAMGAVVSSTSVFATASPAAACACGQCDVGCQCCADETVSCDDCQCVTCVCEFCDDVAATATTPSCCVKDAATMTVAATKPSCCATSAPATGEVAAGCACGFCEVDCQCCADDSVDCDDCTCGECVCPACVE